MMLLILILSPGANARSGSAAPSSLKMRAIGPTNRSPFKRNSFSNTLTGFGAAETTARSSSPGTVPKNNAGGCRDTGNRQGGAQYKTTS